MSIFTVGLALVMLLRLPLSLTISIVARHTVVCVMTFVIDVNPLMTAARNLLFPVSFTMGEANRIIRNHPARGLSDGSNSGLPDCFPPSLLDSGAETGAGNSTIMRCALPFPIAGRVIADPDERI